MSRKPPVAAATDTLINAFVLHLEYLGYETRRPENEDGWYLATHPDRWHFMFAESPVGVRIFCQIVAGPAAQLKRDAWLEFLNSRADDLRLARVALVEDADGDFVLRIRALLPPTYDRTLFGRLMNLWHADLDGLRDGPTADDLAASENDTVN